VHLSYFEIYYLFVKSASVQCASDCDSEEVCCVQIKRALSNLRSLLNCYFNNIPRIIRVAWHVGRKGERGGVYRVFIGKPEGRGHLEDTDVNGRIILRWIIRKWDVGARTESNWLTLGTGGGHL